MLDSKFKYYRTRLNDVERAAYDTILVAWANRNPTPTVSVPSNVTLDIDKITTYIFNDNPGLFYIETGFSYTITPKEIKIDTRLTYSVREIDEIEAKIKSIKTAIRSKHNTDNLGVYEKEVILHDSLVKNIVYSKNGLVDETQTIVGGLIKRRCVCAGYAASFKMLCDMFDIPSIKVSGTATSRELGNGNHAWNIVKLNGECSHVDITWDATSKGDLEKCYDNFNLTDSDIGRDHKWDRGLLPVCNSIKNNWHYKNGCCVKDIDEFKNYLSTQFSLGKKIIPVRFDNKIENQGEILKAAKSALYHPKAMKANALTRLSGFTIKMNYNEKRGTAIIILDLDK